MLALFVIGLFGLLLLHAAAHLLVILRALQLRLLLRPPARAARSS